MADDEGSKIRLVLFRWNAQDYGSSHADHVLAMYQAYLEKADRISARRERANSFFLSLNTALVAFTSYVLGGQGIVAKSPWLGLVAVAGAVLSYLWFRILRSYRDLNSAKFKVIHEIEKILPIRPYDAEWEAVGRGRDPRKYLPFTHIEKVVPWVFFGLHGVVIVWAIPWSGLAHVWGIRS